MHRQRIFIAINLLDDAKKKLASYYDKWPELPVRWTKKENLHITLAFIGNVSDEQLLEISKAVKKVASSQSHFSIKLDKITYGPPKKMPPRMVWACGEKSAEFGKLKEDLEKSLMDSSANYSPEIREFSLPAAASSQAMQAGPHITLGRIGAWEWRKIEEEERPQIDEDISLNLFVNSIEIMESELRKGGPKYTVLESHELEG